MANHAISKVFGTRIQQYFTPKYVQILTVIIVHIWIPLGPELMLKMQVARSSEALLSTSKTNIP
jgi:hypothetical protein